MSEGSQATSEEHGVMYDLNNTSSKTPQPKSLEVSAAYLGFIKVADFKWFLMSKGKMFQLRAYGLRIRTSGNMLMSLFLTHHHTLPPSPCAAWRISQLT